MLKKESFIKWMEQSTILSESTREKYARAITINSSALIDYGVIEGSLYNITDPKVLVSMKEKYLSIAELRDKDERGNRMYSSAFNYFELYLEQLKSSADRAMK